MKPRFPLLALLCLLPALLAAQSLPQGYFASPLNSDIALSATFAEFRANHFHGGLDMRTGGVTGLPVKAAADGYVCGVRISPWGGGKMLYIKHPNGYTSVYMHLDRYAGDIARYVLKEQYAEESYSIVRDIPEGLLPVRKGQVVAYSGNTGSSGGPHLHFELRHEGRGWNPLHFGLPYRDTMKPTIRGVRLYSADGLSVQVAAGSRVESKGDFYIGVYTTDAAEGSTPRNGFDHMEVYLDGNLFYRYTTVCTPLDSSRMVNALIDYPTYASSRQAYLLTRQLPGANGPWVSYCKGDGRFSLPVGTTHTITVKVYDVAMNCAEQSFTVVVGAAPTSTPAPTGTAIQYQQPAALDLPYAQLQLAAHTLYADDWLRTEATADSHYLSPLVRVEPTLHVIPPHRPYTLRLRARPNATPDRVVMVRIDNQRRSAYATHREGDWYVAEVRDFGLFALTFDTLAPTIRPINYADHARAKSTTLRLKLTDDLSGIDTYRCTLNGQWLLAEYDGKTATLVLDAASKLRSGHNTLVVSSTDGAGNTATRQYDIVR